jgi:cation-transporting ATPase E
VPIAWFLIEAIGFWHRRRFGTASEIAEPERKRRGSAASGEASEAG